MTVSNLRLNKAMRLANPDDESLKQQSLLRRKWLYIVLGIESIGLIMAFMAPSWSLIPAAFALIYIMFARRLDSFVERRMKKHPL